MKKIYLAGPGVFEKNAIELGAKLKELCREYGFEGLYPLDNVLNYEDPKTLAKEIRLANITLIREADIVMANLNPFRGFEPDSGTVYEVGFSEALGKEVFSYAKDCSSMKERLIIHQELAPNAKYCQEGKIIEDFDLSHNLMFAHTLVATDAKSCLQTIRQHFNL